MATVRPREKQVRAASLNIKREGILNFSKKSSLNLERREVQKIRLLTTGELHDGRLDEENGVFVGVHTEPVLECLGHELFDASPVANYSIERTRSETLVRSRTRGETMES